MRQERADARIPSDEAVRAVAALDDQLRRGMYDFIRGAHRPVTREEAAAEVGISRKLAAFHLDKLVAAGLLRTRYESINGRRKVGRKPKVYEPTAVEIQISIPVRNHDALADILVEAIHTDSAATDAATHVARARGEAAGRAERARRSVGRLGAERALTAAEHALRARGFEPQREGALCVRLKNCPFQPFATTAPELVCRLNHAFVLGFVSGLETSAVQAILAPRPGECCVELRARRQVMPLQLRRQP